MKMTLHRLRLPLAHEFTIARGSLSTQSSLIVELEHDGIRGLGEVTVDRFYGHSFESMTKSLNIAAAHLNQYIDAAPADVWASMRDVLGGDHFALSALDMAAHDLHGRRLGLPSWKVWGLEWNDVPDSSYTIGIDAIDVMTEKLHEQSGWGVYKIKLGTTRDIEIVTELRKQTDAVFRVDANCGWSAEQAIEYSKSLADLGVEFIEQPLPQSAMAADKQRVFSNSALPIIADEDCQTLHDVQRCLSCFHGVNVKICKCGGLTPALQMLRNARESGLKTMIGCMVESSIGISAAAQLLPLLDYADLDGAVLLSDEPATGVKIKCGEVTMPDQDGCGADLVAERLPEFLIST